MKAGQKLKFKDQGLFSVERKLIVPDQSLQFDGRWHVEHWRGGKIISEHFIHNDVTNAGKNDLFDKYFRNGTTAAAWYIGLIDSSGFTAFAAGDTMSSHSGWNEFTTYDEATRVAWGPDAAASQAITNSTKATFNIAGSGTIKGILVVTVSTKGGTTGILWSTAAFTTPPPVADDDQLKVTYNLSA